MNPNYRYLLAAALLGGSTAWAAHTPVISPNYGMTQYDVVKRGDAVTIDGKIDEDIWAQIPALAGGFHYPWAAKEAPPTVFKAFSDGENLYFSFAVSDKQVLASEHWRDENTWMARTGSSFSSQVNRLTARAKTA